MNTSRLFRMVLGSLVFTVFTGCAPGAPDAVDLDDVDDEASALGTEYVEIGDYFTSDAELEGWLTLRRTLASAFEDACGDTFCEGDYTNIAPLDFTCSVTKKRGRLKECAWTFAASSEMVQGADGTVTAAVPFFVCRVRPKGKAGDLLAALGGEPLYAKLPGLDGSLYDALGDCFEEPVDPVTLPEPSEGVFGEVADQLEGEEIDAWYAMTRALAADFDEVCGDTFCEGDFTNWQPLRLRCSENTETEKIGSCTWSFAGSDSWAKKKGSIGVAAGEATCTFTVDATASDLAVALAPDAGGERPLWRPLPGSGATIYDALIDCL